MSANLPSPRPDELSELVTMIFNRGKAEVHPDAKLVFQGVTYPNQIDALRAYVAKVSRSARHEVVEEIGAIGTDFSDKEDAKYRIAVELYVIDERKKWAALAAGEQRKEGK